MCQLRGSVALIARRSRTGRLDWCLPKGHLEGNETPEQTAVREIEEETGIRGRVTHEIGTIDYWFSQGGRRVHKTVHHYLLAAKSGALSLEGDPDAEAVEVAWVPLQEIPHRLSFVNERRIAQLAMDLLAESA